MSRTNRKILFNIYTALLGKAKFIEFIYETVLNVSRFIIIATP